MNLGDLLLLLFFVYKGNKSFMKNKNISKFILIVSIISYGFIIFSSIIASALKCFHKEPGENATLIDCEEYDRFRKATFCQETRDDDSIGKSCVNTVILEDIQRLFPQVKGTSDCYKVQFNRTKNGTVCLCSEDECNTGTKIKLQITSFIFVLFMMCLCIVLLSY